MARAAPNPPSPVADSGSEADRQRRRIVEQVAAWFSLVGVARSRGKQKRNVMASLWKQRGKKRDEAGVGVGSPRGEEEEGGGGGFGGRHRPDTARDGRHESRGSRGGRRGGGLVGQLTWWGPAGGGEGGYDMSA
jgi:hypothetical protein